MRLPATILLALAAITTVCLAADDPPPVGAPADKPAAVTPAAEALPAVTSEAEAPAAEEPAFEDRFPVWSPDGSKIAFVSDCSAPDIPPLRGPMPTARASPRRPRRCQWRTRPCGRRMASGFTSTPGRTGRLRYFASTPRAARQSSHRARRQRFACGAFGEGWGGSIPTGRRMDCARSTPMAPDGSEGAPHHTQPAQQLVSRVVAQQRVGRISHSQEHVLAR
jgi:hypothetical protein